jgi:hypothetical protein
MRASPVVPIPGRARHLATVVPDTAAEEEGGAIGAQIQADLAHDAA